MNKKHSCKHCNKVFVPEIGQRVLDTCVCCYIDMLDADNWPLHVAYFAENLENCYQMAIIAIDLQRRKYERRIAILEARCHALETRTQQKGFFAWLLRGENA